MDNGGTKMQITYRIYFIGGTFKEQNVKIPATINLR